MDDAMRDQVERVRGMVECPCCQVKPLPCPFCGQPGKIYAENCVGCESWKCGATVNFGHWYDEENNISAVHWVIKHWNERKEGELT